jgi:hypothetical protein
MIKNKKEFSWNSSGGQTILDIQGDNFQVLESACAIVLHTVQKLTVYSFGTDEISNKDHLLYLAPYKLSHHNKSILELPFPIDDCGELADFIRKWLIQKAIYPDHNYSGDGSYVNGYHLKMSRESLIVNPKYIYYGK